jgi:cysteine desulfurase
MGALTHGNVRVSLPRSASDLAVTAFLDALPPIVARIRETVRAATPRTGGLSPEVTP